MSSTESGAYYAYSRYLYYGVMKLGAGKYDRHDAMSVRCVKD